MSITINKMLNIVHEFKLNFDAIKEITLLKALCWLDIFNVFTLSFLTSIFLVHVLGFPKMFHLVRSTLLLNTRKETMPSFTSRFQTKNCRQKHLQSTLDTISSKHIISTPISFQLNNNRSLREGFFSETRPFFENFL